MFEKIKEKIEEAKNILLIGHINPDGDTIGAGTALLLALRKYYPNKVIDFVLQDNIPNNITFLEVTSLIKKVDDIDEKYDLTIFVDTASLNRAGECVKFSEGSYKINIDHHISNPNYGDINIVDSKSASTCEIIFKLLEELNYDIDKHIGECLYLGIVNDTGNFTHSNVTKDTLEIAKKLVEIGVDNNYIVTNFLKKKSYNRLKLLADALTNFKFNESKKFIYYFMPYKVLEKYGGDKSETEGIVEELMNYDKAEVALFLREEKDGIIKGSMRSKNEIDVNKIASIFEGGGHSKAAGFKSLNLSKDEIINKIVEKL